jgi:hypothetical protein
LLLEQGELAGTSLAAVDAVHGKGHVFEGFGLFGQSFEVAAGQDHERGIEIIGIERTKEGTHTADIVAHSHDRTPLKTQIDFSRYCQPVHDSLFALCVDFVN